MSKFSWEEIQMGIPGQQAYEAWQKRKARILSGLSKKLGIKTYHNWSEQQIERRIALAWQIVEIVAKRENYTSKEELVMEIKDYPINKLESLLQKLRNEIK